MADNVLFWGFGSDFFFSEHGESFIHAVTADVSVREHSFHYVTDVLLLFTNSKKTMVKCYDQMLSS